MKSKISKINIILLLLFMFFFIYQNIILIYLMKNQDIKFIYPYHHEIFYNRIIYYELEISTYTHFTINSIFKIIFNFIQSIGIVEILYILLAIPLYLDKEKSNKTYQIYTSFYNVFLIKIFLVIIIFLLAYLTYNLDISIAWLIISLIFIISIIYEIICSIRLIKYLFS